MQRVECLNTGRVYTSLSMAAKAAGTSYRLFYQRLRKGCTEIGELDGEPLHWRLVEDADEVNDERLVGIYLLTNLAAGELELRSGLQPPCLTSRHDPATAGLRTQRATGPDSVYTQLLTRVPEDEVDRAKLVVSTRLAQAGAQVVNGYFGRFRRHQVLEMIHAHPEFTAEQVADAMGAARAVVNRWGDVKPRRGVLLAFTTPAGTWLTSTTPALVDRARSTTIAAHPQLRGAQMHVFGEADDVRAAELTEGVQRLMRGEHLLNGRLGPVHTKTAQLAVTCLEHGGVPEVVVDDLTDHDTRRVYRVVCVDEPGVVYVGSTHGSLLTRLKQHAAADTALGEVIRRHGLEAMRIRLLETCPDRVSMLAAEERCTRAEAAEGVQVLNVNAGSVRLHASGPTPIDDQGGGRRGGRAGRRADRDAVRRRAASVKARRGVVGPDGRVHRSLHAAAVAAGVTDYRMGQLLSEGAGWAYTDAPPTVATRKAYTRRAVRCVTTGTTFATGAEAARWAGLARSTVLRAADRGATVGTTPDGRPAQWTWADEAPQNG